MSEEPGNRFKIVLCVHNDIDNAELVAVILGLHNYRVDIAPTAAEGLQRTRQNRYDLIILDHYFTDGCGVELCRAIRRFDRTTPILFYASEARDKEIRAAVDAGAQGYLVKPVDPSLLLSNVKRHTGELVLQERY